MILLQFPSLFTTFLGPKAPKNQRHGPSKQGFWLAELSFHHVAPPESFVFGLCAPKGCRAVAERVAKPFLRRLFASEEGSDWCRLELSEWREVEKREAGSAHLLNGKASSIFLSNAL